ncbi:hypothetical protein ZMTM_18530 [Methyloradius palustris]|uniref:Uncharacterized protein n=2 Tax=Methyloradius palustris TaxID=2778876 RepID=A0A8D5G0A7_9PROT|nr:hypothetical protein ZMTM_18530 [Methyloradius palustris]
MTFIKNNPIKLLILLFLTLNCFGFCYQKLRFLSDHERIEIAVSRLLNFYEGSEISGTVNSPVYIINDSDHKKIYDQVPYSSLEEVFEKNPNCCEVSRVAKVSEGKLTVNAWGCLTGLSPYFVTGKIALKIKVGDEIKAGYSEFSYYISSCGTLYSLFD